MRDERKIITEWIQMTWHTCVRMAHHHHSSKVWKSTEKAKKMYNTTIRIRICIAIANPEKLNEIRFHHMAIGEDVERRI